MTSKDKAPQGIWEYMDWLYQSGRLTAEEHATLKKLLLDAEYTVDSQGC